MQQLLPSTWRYAVEHKEPYMLNLPVQCTCSFFVYRHMLVYSMALAWLS